MAAASSGLKLKPKLKPKLKLNAASVGASVSGGLSKGFALEKLSLGISPDVGEECERSHSLAGPKFSVINYGE